MNDQATRTHSWPSVEKSLRHPVCVFQDAAYYAWQHAQWPHSRNRDEPRTLQFPTLLHLLITTDEHQRSEIDRKKTERHHRENSGAKEGYQYPAYDGA